MILGGEGHRRQLGLIAHLGDEECDRHRPEGPKIEPFILPLEFVAADGPETEEDERRRGGDLDVSHRYDIGKVVTRQHCQEVIAYRCGKDPPQDYGGLVSGGKGHGEQLGFVSHLRQDDKPEREEKGHHIAIPPG